MGKLSLRLIALGFLILTLGTYVYMDLLANKIISEPVAMFFFGTCLTGIGKLGSTEKKE